MMTGVVGERFVVSSHVSTLASCWVVRRLAVGVERFARISHASAVCRVRAAAQGGMATRMFWLARANYASAATDLVEARSAGGLDEHHVAGGEVAAQPVDGGVVIG